MRSFFCFHRKNLRPSLNRIYSEEALSPLHTAWLLTSFLYFQICSSRFSNFANGEISFLILNKLLHFEFLRKEFKHSDLVFQIHFLEIVASKTNVYAIEEESRCA